MKEPGKGTGLIRKVDELGRVVLPPEIREQLDVQGKDRIKFSWDGNHLVLEKHEPGCTFCGGTDGIVTFAGKRICRACRVKIAKMK